MSLHLICFLIVGDISRPLKWSVYFFVDQMVKISTKECKKRWEKIKFLSSGTNSLKSHLEGFIIKGKKRLADELAPNSPDARFKDKKDGFPSVIDKAGAMVPSTGEAPLSPTTWWNDVGFDTL